MNSYLKQLGFHFHQILLGFDQLANAILGGWSDETLSARCWRLSTKSLVWRSMRVIIDRVFFFQKNHCEEAYLSEVSRRHLPPEYRPID